MRERLERVTYSENDVRRLRKSDSALDRLYGEWVKFFVELWVAAAGASLLVIWVAFVHPDVSLTWRLERYSAIEVWTGVTAFLVMYFRCWFAD